MGTAVVAIKLGEQGLYVRTSARRGCGTSAIACRWTPDAWCDREVVSPCFRARRVAGTTGAGDCTIAGFLAALLRGEGPVQAATSATAVGACERRGARRDQRRPAVARARRSGPRRVGPQPIRIRSTTAARARCLGTLTLSRPDKEPA